MITAEKPVNELERIAALDAYHILDTPVETAFDAITRTAALICDVPIAMISLVDHKRQWFKSVLGLPGVTETSRDLAFCSHAILGKTIFEVEDAREDERFSDNPLVTADPNIRFYAGAPLVADKELAIGTLCVIDRIPKHLTEHQNAALAELSGVVMHLLDVRKSHVEATVRLQKANGLLNMAEGLAHLGHWRVDLATQKIVWSDEVYRIHGWPLGTSTPSISVAINAYHPDDVEGITTLFTRAVESGESFSCELRLVRSDGTIRNVSSSGQAERGRDGKIIAVFGIFQDITDRKDAERERAKLAERTRLATEAGQLGIWEWSIADDVFLGDQGMYRLFGIDPSTNEMLKKDWNNRIHPDDIARVDADVLACLRYSQPYDTEYRVIWPNGELHHLRSRGTVIFNSDGEPRSMIGTNWEITEMRVLTEQLAAEKQRAEDANHAKSNFLATMSHEIRTPMNGVMGMNGLLLNTDLSAQQRKLAEGVRYSADSLLTIIDDILDVSKLDAGKIELEELAFDLPLLIEKSIELHTSRAVEKGITLTTSIASSARRSYFGDPTRLRQIVLNLVSNAIKFTDQGSVKVGVRGHDLENGSSKIWIEVQDSGIGIDDEAKQRLFQPFAQADSSITRRFGGTGLGLNISQKLINLMGGEIGILDTPGGGTIFWIELTLSHAEVAIATPTSWEKAAETSKSTCGGHILLAEDNEINIDIATMILESFGYTVDVAHDGIEAVAAMRGGGYDLVLMDLQMPNLDGLSATREIRAAEARKTRIPIIAMTANAMKGDEKLCLAAGMDDYISKPVDPQKLLETIERWIGIPAQPSAELHQPALSSVLDMPVVDENAVETLRLIFSDKKFFPLLESYLREAEVQSVRLESLKESQAVDEIGQEAHKIIAAAGNFGARQVQELATRLQTLCRSSGNMKSISTLVDELRSAIIPASAHLRQWLLAHQEQKVSNAAGH